MMDAAPADSSRYAAIAAGTTTARPGSRSTGSKPSVWSAAAPSTATSECGTPAEGSFELSDRKGDPVLDRGRL